VVAPSDVELGGVAAEEDAGPSPKAQEVEEAEEEEEKEEELEEEQPPDNMSDCP